MIRWGQDEDWRRCCWGLMASKPLVGWTVALTRRKERVGPWAVSLNNLGAQVALTPVIEIIRLSLRPLIKALKRLDEYDGVVLTSVPGAEFFVEGLRQTSGARRVARKITVGAVGPATGWVLQKHGLRPSVIPSQFGGTELANILKVRKGSRWLFPRALNGLDHLPSVLKNRGANVKVVSVYKTVPVALSSKMVKRLMAEKGHLMVMCTSPSTVEYFLKGFSPRERRHIREARFVSIGPTTTAALRRRGISRIMQAKSATMEDMIKAVVKAAKGRKK